MATSLHNNRYEINNLGRPFLGHHYYTISLYGQCTGIEKKINLKIHQFYSFYPQTTFPWGGGGGDEIYNFLSPYPSDATYQILFSLPSSS